ncbi:glycosyltransferase family A protein [Ruegeria arenilitoris]|uniref:glycosyltransferase family A protein n=1 Tax=Ruegeria arenilitoris TaxID=1173585 RepID=UPI00147B7F35|nr:glycosyltransferase family 2 protein [Ruegeria arenilitoris]
MSHLCSVLCVSYNHAKFAAAGLQSIYEQTYRNIEIIVLDDGSPDNSVEKIEAALAKSPFPTTFIKQENSGNVPANFNKVLDAASGEFVTMMSLDDLLMPDCIKDAVEVLSKDRNIVFAANTGHYEIDENGHRITDAIHLPLPANHPETAQDLIELEYRSLGSFYIQGQVFRRDALIAVGGFDDTMTGDDIVLRTRLFQHMVRHPELTFSLGNKIVLSYRKHGNNLHKNAFRQIKTIVQWAENYFPGRTYPDLFFLWLEHFIEQSIRQDRPEDIRKASDLSPQVAQFIQSYQKTWTYRRRNTKRKIRKLFGA